MKHENCSVYAFNTVIINEAKELTQVSTMSDGAGSQFKNKYTMMNVLYHGHDVW